MACDVSRSPIAFGESIPRRLVGVCLAFALVSGTGCNQAKVPQDLVALGLVTYNGKPLPLGELRMVPDDKGSHPVITSLQFDGRYRATGLQPGRYRISVRTSGFVLPGAVSREPEKEKEKEDTSAKAGQFPIPDKYENPETSGLAIEIKEKTNEFNIDLK